MPKANKPDVKIARILRKNMTLPERLLWSALKSQRAAGIRFRRQHPCKGYVLDFAHLPSKTGIELDGWSHHFTGDQDLQRQRELEVAGWTIYRFENKSVLSDPSLIARHITNLILRAAPPPTQSGEVGETP